jgi:transcriptional regulator with XRE-family HTH domain
MLGEAERRSRFGYALQRALQYRHISERQLAKQLEIDARKVAQWRTGKSLPDLYQTQALAAALRVSEDLFRNPPPVPPEPAYPIEDYLDESVDAAVDAALAEQPDVDPPAARSSSRRSRTRGR